LSAYQRCLLFSPPVRFARTFGLQPFFLPRLKRVSIFRNVFICFNVAPLFLRLGVQWFTPARRFVLFFGSCFVFPLVCSTFLGLSGSFAHEACPSPCVSPSQPRPRRPSSAALYTDPFQFGSFFFFVPVIGFRAVLFNSEHTQQSPLSLRACPPGFSPTTSRVRFFIVGLVVCLSHFWFFLGFGRFYLVTKPLPFLPYSTRGPARSFGDLFSTFRSFCSCDFLLHRVVRRLETTLPFFHFLLFFVLARPESFCFCHACFFLARGLFHARKMMSVWPSFLLGKYGDVFWVTSLFFFFFAFFRLP